MATHKQKFEILDGLRGIAAISVMLMHFLQDLPIPILQSAYLSVDVFFMLSGFILTYSYGERLRHGTWLDTYLKRRVIRLYPMICIGITIGFVSLVVMKMNSSAAFSLGNLAAATGQNYFVVPYLGRFLVSGFAGAANHGLPAVNDPGVFPLNPPAWSLFFESFASVALVAAIRISERNLLRLAYACFGAFVVYGVLVGFDNGKISVILNQGWSADNFMGGFFRVGYGFLLGVAIGKMYDANLSAKPHWFIAGLVKNDYMLFVAFVMVVAFPTSIKGTYSMAILLFVAPALVYRGAMLTPSGKTMARISAFLGWISYPLYCVHYPIGRLVFAYAPQADIHIVRTAMVAALLSTVAAVGFAKFIEEPIRSYLSGRLFGDRGVEAGSAIGAG
ncbi:acyltransferase family protein [Burkholderia latens]|uniref:Acyltransferase n=1 Tax=Burkholderia latens TaxID=488446 RepID=A0A6H9TTL9_9BURK|nr:acyltransferase [Burkholderia latens]KAB0643692.1 acyltransferase [Burkholderia latens]VWB69952.1 acyltransferase [Burkholderia latens]